MSTAEIWIDEPEDGPVTTDPVELDAWIDYQLRRLADIGREMQHNREVMRREIERAQNWCDAMNAVLERRAEHIKNRIREHTVGYDYRGRKSRTLPSGRFGTRLKPARLEIADKAAAIAFAKAHDVPVRLKEEPDARALKEYAESTGVTPDGCTLIEATEEFFAEAAK